MEVWLIHVIEQHPYFVYAIIALISSFEGPILALLCGVLLKLDLIPFWPAYVALMIGDLLGDTFWYFIGYHFGHRFIARFGHYFSITEEGVTTVTRLFHRFHNRILILNKITMGLGFALVTLVTAGIARVPFKQYIFMNILGQFIWTGFLLIVGYFFGNVYLTVDGVLGKISLIALIVIGFVALLGYGKYIRKKMTAAIPS